MDDRKNKIKELEEKMRADTDTRNRLLEGLGENLLQRIGESEPFPEKTGNTPGGALAEFRRLRKEITESTEIIKSLNTDVQRLKELEEQIAAREEEFSRFDRELEDVHMQLGKALLESLDSDNTVGPLREQEERLLAKIDEQESRLEELKDKEGGILSWLGKNAQMAVSKTILQKNRSALQKFYHNTGKKFLDSEQQEIPRGEAASAAVKAAELRERLSEMASDLTALKAERRKIGDVFGAEGSPSRRIQGLEKHIAHVKGEFSGVYLNFGSLAAVSEAGDSVSPFLSEEDDPVLERAKLLKFRIAEEKLEIEKIGAAISIDDENAEIEKMNKAIQGQRQKIAAAESDIEALSEKISVSEKRIEELKAFIGGNSGAKEEHGSENKGKGKTRKTHKN